MRLTGSILVLMLLAAGFSAQAGVVVFKNGTVLVTTKQIERAGQLIVGLPSGDAIYLPDQVVWVSKDPALDSLWKAAQLASQEGKADVALLLAREAAMKEPANAAAAKQMVVEAESKLQPTQPVAQTGAATGGFAAAPGTAGTPAAGPTPASAGTAETPEAAPEMVVTGAHGWPVDESAISAEDLRINALVVGIFGLLVLLTLWKMTVSEA